MIMLLFSLGWVVLLACFYPFLDLGYHERTPQYEPQQDLTANIQHMKARIASNIEIEAEQCLFSGSTMVFHEVYLIDHLAGAFHAKRITWNIGSEELLCSEMIDGNLHAQRIAVKSQEATYNMKSGMLQWGESTEWSLKP